MIGLIVITGVKAPLDLTASAIPMPMRIPRKPPITPIMTASMRNWVIIVSYVAPNALRMPISLVRSVTDTIMIFMMPMPPTMREIAAILPRKRVSMAVVLFMVSKMLVRLLTVKSSSLPFVI